MAKSSVTDASNKPQHDFPLAPYGDRLWRKGVLGKLERYSGTAEVWICESDTRKRQKLFSIRSSQFVEIEMLN
jgi:hypothetical protein